VHFKRTSMKPKIYWSVATRVGLQNTASNKTRHGWKEWNRRDATQWPNEKQIKLQTEPCNPWQTFGACHKKNGDKPASRNCVPLQILSRSHVAAQAGRCSVLTIAWRVVEMAKQGYSARRQRYDREPGVKPWAILFRVALIWIAKKKQAVGFRWAVSKLPICVFVCWRADDLNNEWKQLHQKQILKNTTRSMFRWQWKRCVVLLKVSRKWPYSEWRK